MTPTKIVSKAPAGEKPRRPRRVTLRRTGLRTYAWDKRAAATAGWTVLRGSIEIARLAFRWCAAAEPGDRLWRAVAVLGGPIAAAYYGTPRLPAGARSALPGLLIVAWTAAAAVLGHRALTAAAKAKPTEAKPTEEEPAPADRAQAVRDALLQLLEIHTRGRNGIHLGELHQILAKTTAYRALKKSGVAPLLEAHGIPWKRTLSVGGIAGRSGVARDAVLTLIQARSPEAPTDHSQSEETGSDLHESQQVSDDSRPAHTSIYPR